VQAQALNEPRRRSYLQALGLDLLRARSALPGAAASVEWDEPALPSVSSSSIAANALAVTSAEIKPAAAAKASSPSVSTPATLPAAALAAREALRGGQPSAAARATKPVILAPTSTELPLAQVHSQTLVSATQAPTSQPNKPLAARFSLLLVPIDATHIALIDLDNQPALEGSEARLWAAICSAQQWQHQALDMPAQFHWPIPGLAATQAAAQEALAGWLQTQHAEHMSCVVFGENLSAVAPSEHKCLPSLQALLAEPLRKRELMLKLHGAI
jgi:hypothetical protein